MFSNSSNKPAGFAGNLGGFLPARLDTQQTAAVLGFQEHEIPVLVQFGQLEPLGNPKQNARKFFARTLIMEVADNPQWLSKATKLMYQHWLKKNANRAKGEAVETIGGAE